MPKARQDAIKVAYINKIKTVGKDGARAKPFLKSKSLKIGDMENPYGIRVAGQVSTYNNPLVTLTSQLERVPTEIPP